MKKQTTMNLTELAATAPAVDLLVADVQGKLKFTKLPPAKPRRSQLVYTTGRVGGSRRPVPQKLG